MPADKDGTVVTETGSTLPSSKDSDTAIRQRVVPIRNGPCKVLQMNEIGQMNGDGRGS